MSCQRSIRRRRPIVVGSLHDRRLRADSLLAQPRRAAASRWPTSGSGTSSRSPLRWDAPTAGMFDLDVPTERSPQGTGDVSSWSKRSSGSAAAASCSSKRKRCNTTRRRSRSTRSSASRKSTKALCIGRRIHRPAVPAQASTTCWPLRRLSLYGYFVVVLLQRRQILRQRLLGSALQFAPSRTESGSLPPVFAEVGQIARRAFRAAPAASAA